MRELSKLSELQAEGERARIGFLRTDLALCFTFTDLVKTELGEGKMEAAGKVYRKAEIGYAVIARFLPEVDGGEDRDEIEGDLRDLRKVLDGLMRVIPPEG